MTMKKLLAVAVVAAVSFASVGADVAVSPSGGPVALPDGTVIPTSYTTVATAVSNVPEANSTIWIDDGEYVFTSHIYINGTKQEGLTFRSVHGAANVILTTPYSAADQATHCFFYSNSSNGGEPVFIGLTFRNGYAADTRDAACIYPKAKEIRDCIFEGNRVASGRKASCVAVGTDSCLVSNCVFRGNGYLADGSIGGGAASLSCSGSNARILDCVFEGNASLSESTANNEGGIFGVGADALVQDCQFVTNRVGVGSLIGARTVVKHCTFVSNTNCVSGNYKYGACLYAKGNDISVLDSFFTNNVAPSTSCLCGNSQTGIVVSNSTFACNAMTAMNSSAVTTGDSAGIYNCHFVGNRAVKSGIAAFNIGANSTVRNCLIANNTGVGDPWVATFGSGSYLENMTAVGNRSTGNSGTAIKGADAETWTYNSVFADNKMANGNYGHIAGVSKGHLYNCHVDSTRPTCLADSTITMGDPKLVDAANGDYRPAQKSPLIDKGQNRDWMVGAKDLGKKNDRIIGKCVDIGCYEFRPLGLMLLIY